MHKSVRLSIILINLALPLIGSQTKTTNRHVFFRNDCTPIDQYQRYCQKVNAKQEQKINQFIKRYCDNIHISCYEKFKNKLQKIQKEICSREKSNLLSLKKDFSIPDDTWNTILDIDRKIQNFEDTHKHLPVTNPIRDKNISKSFSTILEKHLAYKGINPQRIDIMIGNDDEYGHRSPIARWSFNQTLIFPIDDVLVCRGGIVIDKFNYSPKQQEAFGLLFAHLIDEKKYVTYAIIASFAHEFNSTMDEIFQSTFFSSIS